MFSYPDQILKVIKKFKHKKNCFYVGTQFLIKFLASEVKLILYLKYDTKLELKIQARNQNIFEHGLINESN